MSSTVMTRLPILMATLTLAFVGLSPALASSECGRTVDLGEPRSSEQFFNQGRQQFELEIQRLQNPRPATPLLIIRSAPPMEIEVPLQVPGQSPPPPPPAIAPTPPAR
jgi:hypothetical protein